MDAKRTPLAPAILSADYTTLLAIQNLRYGSNTRDRSARDRLLMPPEMSLG